MKKLKPSIITSLFKPKPVADPVVCKVPVVCDGEKLMVIGFFDRGNVGDEAFIAPYQILFPEKVLSFHSIDDIQNVPDDVAAVIVAGGDVINNYFTDKLREILDSYKGPCYAFSVGIPYMSEAKNASIFDHVVLRTKQDVAALGDVIGAKNVSYLPDVTWMLNAYGTGDRPNQQTQPTNHKKRQNQGITFGICLAQPYFDANENSQNLIETIVKFLYTLITTYKNCRINLIAFNTSIYEHESDHFVNDAVHKRLTNYENVRNITLTSLHQPLEMLNFIGTHDMIIGMRYHSILFSMMRQVPFVALYTSRKIKNLLADTNTSDYGLEMPNSYYTHYKPVSVDVDRLIALVGKRLHTQSATLMDMVDLNDYQRLVSIVRSKTMKQVLVKTFVNLSCDETLERCKTMIKSYLSIDDTAYDAWEHAEVQTQTLLEKSNKDPTDFARLISFGITNKIGTPYVWGLSENLMKSDFIPSESIKWIYEDFVSNNETIEKNHIYHQQVQIQRKVIIDLNYMCQDNYSGLHRSGWSYVISGLQNLDGKNLEKPSQVIVDTCLERSFLWGLNVTKTSKIVPYTTPWTGFVHHTFDTQYSRYNCETMLDTPEFQESLPRCKCIFTLTDYLKTLFKQGLVKRGFENVPVLSLVHPTEIVSNVFDVAKFLNNPERKAVNIGAWLRDPYAIHALPIPENNRLSIKKYALKGKEMENYFMPAGLFEKMFEFLVECNEVDPGNGGTVSRSDISDILNNVSRSDDLMCRTIKNKYLEGMIRQLKIDESSVNTIEKMADGDYDDLLSQNIVFLSFSSAPSASNTVIECIVRNTPLIVNRYPSLEEVLGKDYPGFYPSGNLFQAASMIVDLNHIYVIHEYLKNMDNTKFTLDYFMRDFQNKLLSVM